MATSTFSSIATHNTSRLALRFPAELWNSFTPYQAIDTSSIITPRLTLRFSAEIWNYATSHQAFTPIHNTQTKSIAISKRTSVPKQRKPRSCKAKFYRFQYGGPQRRQAGKWINEITYEAPCLLPTCSNCQKWHPHLLDEPEASDEVMDSPEILERKPFVMENENAKIGVVGSEMGKVKVVKKERRRARSRHRVRLVFGWAADEEELF